MAKVEDYLEKHKLVLAIGLIVLIVLSGGILSWRLTQKSAPATVIEKSDDLVKAEVRIKELEAKITELEATAKASTTAEATPTIPVIGAKTGKVAGASTVTGMVNINTASLAQLDTLPGVGPATAQKIIDYRTANGGFKVIEDIMKIKGIKQATFSKMKDRITVN